MIKRPLLHAIPQTPVESEAENERQLVVSESPAAAAVAAEHAISLSNRFMETVGLNMSLLFWKASRVNPVWWLALLSILCAFVLQVLLVRPIDQSATDMRIAFANLETELMEGNQRPRNIADNAQAFFDRLPKRETLPDILARIYATSRKAGVALDESSYEMTSEAGAYADRYEMTFPVEGPYPNLRQFIDGTFAENPYIALDGFSLERSDVQNSRVSAELKLVIFLRQSP